MERVSPWMAFDFSQLISMAPWGTSRASQKSGGSALTSRRLAEVVARSFILGLMGSAMARPSTLKE